MVINTVQTFRLELNCALSLCTMLHSTFLSFILLLQISTFVWYLDKRVHGSIAAQLRAVPPGARITRVRIAGNKDWEIHARGQCFQANKPGSGDNMSFTHIFGSESMQAFVQHATQSSPQRLRLQDITDLIIGVSDVCLLQRMQEHAILPLLPQL